MNRTEIAPLVRERLGLPADDNRVNNTAVYIAINTALRRIPKDFDWNWLVDSETFTLLAGTTSRVIPANWLRTLWITAPDVGFEIRNSQRRAMLKWQPVSGFPQLFSTEGRVITFAPTPSRDVTIEHQFVREEVQLNDDTTEPLCPDSYIDIIVLYAALVISTKLRDAVMLASIKSELDDWKNRDKESNRAKPNLSIRVRNQIRLWC